MHGHLNVKVIHYLKVSIMLSVLSINFELHTEDLHIMTLSIVRFVKIGIVKSHTVNKGGNNVLFMFLHFFFQHGQTSVEDMLTMTYWVIVSVMKVGSANIHVVLTNVNEFVSQFSTLSVRFGWNSFQETSIWYFCLAFMG